uniref:CCHC-type domain-containing protein n=1 Tax=Lepisosteus oculatus TaxID=7918 RepID=W5LW39_LEPOC
ESPLNEFLIEPLFARELRTLTIHLLFNHRVPERDMITFLSRFVDVQGEGKKDLDVLKVWTGKRWYTVRLRPKPSECEGVVHPPAYFSIGPNRGYLFYPGQPVTCKKCFQRGHVATNCPGGVCRKCKATIHDTKIKTHRNEEPLRNFYIEPLFARELRPLTVHRFNPYTVEEDILSFLRRFLDVQDEVVKLLDKRKYWTGKRRYRARFRFSAQAADGLLHPPPSFTIGSNKGYLFYLTCRRCGQEGHMALNCVVQICKRCDGIGHIMSACKEVIKCNLCENQGHVYKDCPKRAGSYSMAISKPQRVEEAAPADLVEL